MSLKIGKSEYEQIAYVKKVEDKGTYALVQLSTSQHNKKLNKTEYSNWSYARFVGKAYEGILDVEPKTAIAIHGIFENKPYEDKGETKWPKNPQMTIFSWEIAEKRENSSSEDLPPVIEDAKQEEFPF
jgi:hypothetical protein